MDLGSPLGRALAAAVTSVRRRDPLGPVLVLLPANGNAALARQSLALAGDFVRVEVGTPERLIAELGRGPLETSGLVREPAGWLPAVIGALLVERDLGRYGPTLRERGWRSALTQVIRTLESAGIGPSALAEVPAPDYRERISLFRTLLTAVSEQRAADRVYGFADLCRSARTRCGSSRWAGAVVLGDAQLPPLAFDVLGAWFAGRPVAEVLADGLGPPSPGGLRAAAEGAEILRVPCGSGPIVLARTPDDVREVHEAAREVVDAVRAGVPLDQIAVVLPDPAQVEVLRAALDASGIPATWLVGPPLAQAPAGRFLLHALNVALDADTVPDWYELLRQPGLRLGAELSAGQTRWRRLLARCGAVADVDAIVRAVADLVTSGAADSAADRIAAANLIGTLHALKRALAPLRSPGTVGEHAERWSELLLLRWVRSEDRDRLVHVVRGLGGAGLGAVLSAAQARDVLRDVLEATPAQEGSLSQPAIRVASPGGLLGGAFARVIVTGLVEGCLPRRAEEDPLLPDALIAEIQRTLGIALPDRSARRAFEDRRFAALRAACTDRLWVSIPATEHLTGRPLVASPYALQLASELAARPVGHRDLGAHTVTAGSRALFGVADPERALNAVEHQLSAVRTDRAAALGLLAHHPIAARLMQHERQRSGQWTVDPRIVAVPGLDGTPISARALERLVGNPGAFFVEDVLGVRAVDELRGRSDVFAPRFLQSRVQRALAEGEPFFAQWDALIDGWRRHRTDVVDVDVAEMRLFAEVIADTLRLGGAWPRGNRVRPEGRLFEDLPWVVLGEVLWADGEVARTLSKKAGNRLVIGAVAHSGSFTRLAVGQFERGHVVEQEARPAFDTLRADLLRVTRAVQAGQWWWKEEHPVRLLGEPSGDDP